MRKYYYYIKHYKITDCSVVYLATMFIKYGIKLTNSKICEISVNI